MKPADIKSSTYIDFNKENNEKESKLKVSGDVKISKNKNIFAKVTFQIGLKKFL